MGDEIEFKVDFNSRDRIDLRGVYTNTDTVRLYWINGYS